MLLIVRIGLNFFVPRFFSSVGKREVAWETSAPQPTLTQLWSFAITLLNLIKLADLLIFGSFELWKGRSGLRWFWFPGLRRTNLDCQICSIAILSLQNGEVILRANRHFLNRHDEWRFVCLLATVFKKLMMIYFVERKTSNKRAFCIMSTTRRPLSQF